MARAIAAKSGFFRSTLVSTRSEADNAVVEVDDFDRKLHLGERDQIAHQHRESAITRQRNYLAAELRRLHADRLRHGVCHRAVDERADQPATSVHGEVASRPDRRRTHIGRENGIISRLLADDPREILGMDKSRA